MAEELSTRDALLKLRRVVSDDSDRSEKIKDLSKQLDEAVTERAAAVEAALATLEGYVELHSRLHGFSNQLDALIVESKASGKVQSVRKKKKATKKIKPKIKPKIKSKIKSKEPGSLTGRTLPPRKDRATGYKGKLDETIILSEREQQFVGVLTERWPLFTTPEFMVRKGIIPKSNHITAKVNQIRKKGVPIESSRQAKRRGEHVTDKSRGYRLIG